MFWIVLDVRNVAFLGQIRSRKLCISLFNSTFRFNSTRFNSILHFICLGHNLDLPWAQFESALGTIWAALGTINLSCLGHNLKGKQYKMSYGPFSQMIFLGQVSQQISDPLSFIKIQDNLQSKIIICWTELGVFIANKRYHFHFYNLLKTPWRKTWPFKLEKLMGLFQTTLPTQITDPISNKLMGLYK